MGNGSSKDNSENPKIAEPVNINIVITKEVTERWKAVRLQKKQQLDEDMSSKSKDGGGGGDVDGSPGGSSFNKTELGEKLTDGTCEAKTATLFASSVDLPTKVNSSTMKLPDVTEETTTNFVDKSHEALQTLDNMDRFGNFFIPRNSPISHDKENVDETPNYSLLNSKQQDTAFLQPTESTDRTAVFEDIDEMVNIKKKFDEKELIMNKIENRDGDSNGTKFYDMDKIHVPIPVLPVILDQDIEGKVTVETVNAWNIKQRFEKVLAENNEHWTGELRRIAGEIEDETRKQANNLQTHIDKIKKDHREAIEPPFGHCNLLVSQIGECYQDNKSEVLKCSELVRQFAQCTNTTTATSE